MTAALESHKITVRMVRAQKSLFTASLVTVLLLVLAFSARMDVAFADAETVCPYVWSHSLKVGSTGEEVLMLQKFLNADTSTMIALSGPGAPGNETQKFGTLTKNAVRKFQEKYAADILEPNGLKSGTGMIGAATRAKLNSLCAKSLSLSNNATSTLANILIVTRGQQPAESLALAGAGGVPFTNFTLTAGNADVHVSAITISRSGPGQDGIFDSVDLTDENGADLGEMHFDAHHRMVFAEDLLIPANTSKTVTILANIAGDITSYDGQSPTLQVDAIDASAPVSGGLPLVGSHQTVNTNLTIGEALAERGQFDPGADQTHYIGDKGVRLAGIRLTANSTEDLTLQSITWRQNGTAGAVDVDSVVTVLNGTAYPAEFSGRDYTSTFSPGIVIHRGESIDLFVAGDLTLTGAQRTLKFDLDGSDAVSVTGNTYGYGVGVIAAGNTAMSGNSAFITSDGTTEGDEGTPFYSAPVITILSGTVVNIQKAN